MRQSFFREGCPWLVAFIVSRFECESYNPGTMDGEGTTTLYRPVGQKEMEIIAVSGFRCFPPRLDWQPIFYPVLNEEYASFIAGMEH
jgi:hypothetical protein